MVITASGQRSPDQQITFISLLCRQRAERDAPPHGRGDDQQGGGAGEAPADGRWTRVPPQAGGQGVSVPLSQSSDGPRGTRGSSGTANGHADTSGCFHSLTLFLECQDIQV